MPGWTNLLQEVWGMQRAGWMSGEGSGSQRLIGICHLPCVLHTSLNDGPCSLPPNPSGLYPLTLSFKSLSNLHPCINSKSYLPWGFPFWFSRISFGCQKNWKLTFLSLHSYIEIPISPLKSQLPLVFLRQPRERIRKCGQENEKITKINTKWNRDTNSFRAQWPFIINLVSTGNREDIRYKREGWGRDDSKVLSRSGCADGRWWHWQKWARREVRWVWERWKPGLVSLRQ